MPAEGTSANFTEIAASEHHTQEAAEAARRAHHHLSGITFDHTIFGRSPQAQAFAQAVTERHEQAVSELDAIHRTVTHVAESTTQLRLNLMSAEQKNTDAITTSMRPLNP